MTTWTKALDAAASKTKINIERFGDKFPHVGENGKYAPLGTNTDWTEGFWTGLLWLCYEYTDDEAYRAAARRTVEDFSRRLDAKTALDHHDIGFLYSLSAKAQWILEKDESAKALTLRAAEHLLSRWRPTTGIIQAWGRQDDPVNGGRIIIDCLMNLPLLYWAYEQTGDAKFYDIAVKHADKSRRFLVRGDDSSYHTFYFDQETGDSLRGGTHQGYRDGSTWTRGQAWGVYGFALSYRYTRNELFLDTSKRMARYFIERLPEDDVAYWDFDVPVGEKTERDSSASAITACGILELLGHLPQDDPDRAFLQDGVERMMRSLALNYSTAGDDAAEGLVDHGSYHVRGGNTPDGYVIWGDYFYVEALMRLEGRSCGYWYER